jgi:uncharacterized glyoxalase superfamily protein PhnB
MKSPPAGWPRLSAAVFYEDPAAAIDWLVKAFAFEVRLKVESEGGHIEHSELLYGEALIMVGGAGGDRPGQDRMVSPRSTGGNTQTLCIYVDDVDEHCARARAAGARVFREPETSDYGPEFPSDRSYGATDPEGHMWFFLQRVRDAKAQAG